MSQSSGRVGRCKNPQKCRFHCEIVRAVSTGVSEVICTVHSRRHRHMMMRSLPACFFLAAFSLELQGQTDQHIPINFAVWAAYHGEHPFRVDDPWRLRAEVTIKRNKGITDAQGYLFRGGVGYLFNRGQQVAGGFAFEYHIPYDSASQPYKWADYRIWEEADFRTKLGNGDKEFKQRFRVEEKWLARKSAPDFDTVTSYQFETMFRYQFGFELPL